jgi:lipopolysaccharide export system protein LptC
MEKIKFSQHVVIHHPGDVVNAMTTLQTDSLTVFPDKQQAKTDAAITITQPDAIVHAVGMLANLELGTIKLLTATRGEYVPTS